MLAHSTTSGDTFQVQGRLQPWSAGSSVSVLTQVAAAIGSDDVTFSLGGAITLNGTATAIAAGGTLTLSGGSITDLSGSTYRVSWATGESMTVSLNGSYINTSIALAAADAGAVQGLLGPDNGNPSTELQLPGGTVLAQPITSSALYGADADAWRVTQATSLLHHAQGETTAAFTDNAFPGDVLTLASLPPGVVAAAEQVARNAGITDPNLIQAAVIDLLVTGDPSAVLASANVQQTGLNLTGIAAVNATEQESTTATITVPYTIYLTAAEAQDSPIAWQVTAPGTGTLGTADVVGGTGAGIARIAAGQTSTQIDVTLLAGALGSLANADLQVTITPQDGEPVVGATAQTEIVNPTPTAGRAPVPLIEQLAGDGTLTKTNGAHVLILGTAEQNGAALYANLAVANAATAPAPAPADDLSGLFTISNFTGCLNTSFDPFSSLAAQTTDSAPVVRLGTGTIGVYTETVVLAPQDTNASGYSLAMNAVTLTVTGSIVPMPLPPPPSVPTGTAWGDVHITTFDGLFYNFQAAGEFTLARSTLAHDSLDVQIRTEQWSPGASVSVIDMVAAGVGTDRVTFGLGRTDTVWINGTAETFAAGGTDASDLTLGVSTAAAGLVSGTVTLAEASDGTGTSGAAPVSIGTGTIDVSGKVYREAAPTITQPGAFITHVGQTTGLTIGVANTAAADGYSEALLANAVSASTGLVAAGTTGEVLAGGSSDLTVGVATGTAGTVSGHVTPDLASDGRGIDGLGTVDLGQQVVTVTGTVQNYATATLEQVSGAGTLTGSGTTWTLNFDTLTQRAGTLVADLGVRNSATGPADQLSGFFTASPIPPPFTEQLSAFSGLNAGQNITFTASPAGTFEQTLTLAATGSNASGYSGHPGRRDPHHRRHRAARQRADHRRRQHPRHRQRHHHGDHQHALDRRHHRWRPRRQHAGPAGRRQLRPRAAGHAEEPADRDSAGRRRRDGPDRHPARRPRPHRQRDAGLRCRRHGPRQHHPGGRQPRPDRGRHRHRQRHAGRGRDAGRHWRHRFGDRHRSHHRRHHHRQRRPQRCPPEEPITSPPAARSRPAARRSC